MAKTSLKISTKKVTLSPIQTSEVEAYGDKRFFVCDGQVLSKISDLPGALKSMNDDTFAYHVNGERNDFANWLGNVFLKGDISKKINKAKDRKAMADLISKAISC